MFICELFYCLPHGGLLKEMAVEVISEICLPIYILSLFYGNCLLFGFDFIIHPAYFSGDVVKVKKVNSIKGKREFKLKVNSKTPGLRAAKNTLCLCPFRPDSCPPPLKPLQLAARFAPTSTLSIASIRGGHRIGLLPSRSESRGPITRLPILPSLYLANLRVAHRDDFNSQRPAWLFSLRLHVRAEGDPLP